MTRTGSTHIQRRATLEPSTLDTKTITLATPSARMRGCWERKLLWYTRNSPCSHKIAITFTPHTTADVRPIAPMRSMYISSSVRVFFHRFSIHFQIEYKFVAAGRDHRHRCRRHHRRRMEAAWFDASAIYCIVAYRIIGRCESILHRLGEHLHNKNRKERKEEETRINSNNSRTQFWTENRIYDKLRKNTAENRTPIVLYDTFVVWPRSSE